MSYATIQILATGTEYDVISFRMTRPLVGAWRAEIEIEADSLSLELSGSVTLRVGDRALVGAIVPGQVDALSGRGRLKIVGGLGGWGGVAVRARDYLDVLPRTLVVHLATDAGERFSTDALDALPLTVLGLWARPSAPPGDSLSILARRLGLSWRVLDSGETWIGVDSYPSAPLVDQPPEEAYGDDGALCVYPGSMALEPGTAWADGRRIDRVVYTLPEGGQLAAELLFARAAGPDLERALFERAVRAVLRELAFLGHYPTRVAAQAADGRVELVPDDSGQAGTPPVPVLYGLPGARAEVEPGARVGLVYAAGDPARPRALGWEQSTPARLIEIDAAEVLLGTDAQRGVVRLDDLGDGGRVTAAAALVYVGADSSTTWSITATAGPTPVTFTLVPGTGTPGALVTKNTNASTVVRAE